VDKNKDLLKLNIYSTLITSY